MLEAFLAFAWAWVLFPCLKLSIISSIIFLQESFYAVDAFFKGAPNKLSESSFISESDKKSFSVPEEPLIVNQVLRVKDKSIYYLS